MVEHCSKSCNCWWWLSAAAAADDDKEMLGISTLNKALAYNGIDGYIFTNNFSG